MASDDLILIDDLPFYRRVALIRDGALDQLWVDDAAASLPQPGAVLAARVAQVFPQHDRVNLDLGAAYPNASSLPLILTPERPELAHAGCLRASTDH